MWHIVVAFCSIPLSYFPCLDSCGCPVSRCAIFALMFRAARVLLILGFLFWILYVAMPWIICVFFPMLVFWLWGTLLICGIYSRGVGDETVFNIGGCLPSSSKASYGGSLWFSLLPHTFVSQGFWCLLQLKQEAKSSEVKDNMNVTMSRI
jgi:hypothetical protein